MKEPEPRTQTGRADRPRRATGPLQTGRGGARGRGKNTNGGCQHGAGAWRGGGGGRVPGAGAAAATPSGARGGRWGSVELPGGAAGARGAAGPAPRPQEPRAAGPGGARGPFKRGGGGAGGRGKHTTGGCQHGAGAWLGGRGRCRRLQHRVGISLGAGLQWSCRVGRQGRGMRPSPHPILMSRVLLGLQLGDARGALFMRIRPTILLPSTHWVYLLATRHNTDFLARNSKISPLGVAFTA
jgi:hypothetical protein